MSESSKLHMIDYKILKKSKVMAIWYVDLHQDVYKFYVNPLLYRSTTYPSVTVKILLSILFTQKSLSNHRILFKHFKYLYEYLVEKL